jgi:hypothetical protein
VLVSHSTNSFLPWPKHRAKKPDGGIRVRERGRDTDRKKKEERDSRMEKGEER